MTPTQSIKVNVTKVRIYDNIVLKIFNLWKGYQNKFYPVYTVDLLSHDCDCCICCFFAMEERYDDTKSESKFEKNYFMHNLTTYIYIAKMISQTTNKTYNNLTI